MTEKEVVKLIEIEKYIYENNISNVFLIQLIELGFNYLNLKTIPQYAKDNNMSYNGVKKYRKIIKIRNMKYVIDND